MEQQKSKSRAGLLIALAWLVYMTSYLGKVNYSASITQIIDFYGVTKAQAGIAPTFFFFAYGIGQVVNGLLCKRYHIKWMILISLMTSAVINLIVAVSSNFEVIKWLWLLNGIAMSVLWPTLIRMLAECLPQKSLGKSSVAMGSSVALGTLIIYGLSALYASISRFKLSFYTAGFSMIAVAVVWLCIYGKATSAAKAERALEDAATVEVKPAEQIQEKTEKHMLLAVLCMLCFGAIGVNLIKDGLNTWVPSILKEKFGLADWISILLTLVLPMLAVFGNATALKAHKRIPDYANHMALAFGLIAVFVGAILFSMDRNIMALMLVGLFAAHFLASTLNSLVTSIFPMFMRGKVNSGLMAGVLNGFCYVGSTISSYGLGAIADHFGWTAVFWTLLSICGLVLVAWVIYHQVKRILKPIAVEKML